jgi:hypothetical protein
MFFQLDLTKTSDGKGTFLTVLAQAYVKKYPDLEPLSKELSHVLIAAKGKHYRSICLIIQSP